ncbi:UNVERIFIED_CONTAM: hypothetical protein PYX00_010693 [Menopon gallinae]|uniref:Uncharacterized protein n=1 Tax=Menopon gallinae TaxID=328185 RepID=A0AAW2HGR4_9NEOP
MRLITVLFVCFLGLAYCQILRPGNPPEESGVPIYEEIKVESVLTVRSKSGSRTGKSFSNLPKEGTNTTDGVNISRRTRSTTQIRSEVNEVHPDNLHIVHWIQRGIPRNSN